APPEFLDRGPQMRLRIDLRGARQVHRREEEIPDLLAHPLRISGPDGRLHLADLLAHLGDHAVHALPVEPDRGGLLLDAIGLEERREPLRAPPEQRLAAGLPPLALLPLPEDALRVQIATLAEDVRVAGDHLGHDAADQIDRLRAVLALEDDREEHDEKEEIAQLLACGGAITVRQRLADLVRLLHQVGAQALRGLLLVPGTPVRAGEMPHQIQELRGRAREFLSVGGGAGIRKRRGHARSIREGNSLWNSPPGPKWLWIDSPGTSRPSKPRSDPGARSCSS